MAIGLVSDMKLIPEVFFAGMSDTLAENITVFNDNSNGAIRLVNEASANHRTTENFFQFQSGLVTRRDIASVAAITADKLTMQEINDIKLNRKYFLAHTLDSLRKTGLGMEDFSFEAGRQAGVNISKDYVDTVIKSNVAALTKAATTFRDITGAVNKAITYDELIDTMALFGDSSSNFRAIVMHSKPFFKLFKDATDVLVHNVAGVALYEARIPSFNLPVIVTDNANLVVADGGGAGVNSYYTMILSEGASNIVQSELGTVDSGIERGLENLVMEIQGEYAYNVRLKGWDFSNAITNPTDAQLTNAANWTYRFGDVKNGAGVILESLLA